MRAASAPAHRPRICFPFAGGTVGGSHISALKLIKGIDTAQFEPVVLLGQKDGAVGELFRAEGIQAEEMPVAMPLAPGVRPAPSVLLALPGRLAAMVSFLRARRIGLVHTNEGAMHVNWTLAARLAGLPHIWHHRGNPRALGLRMLAPLFASRVISVSSYAAPLDGLYSSRRKTNVIYSPFDQSIADVDRAQARAGVERKLGLPPGTRIVSFLGHFAERKRPEMFVAALAAYRQAHPGVPIVGLIFGEEESPGQEEALRQTIGRLHAGDFIRMMGFQRPIEPWLAASDALLVPAIEEPFGRTLIEAMLLGTPVVAAASGGNIEAISHGRTGLLVPPEDISAYVAALHALFREASLAEAIASAARNEAKQKFGVESHVREVLQVYRGLLDR